MRGLGFRAYIKPLKRYATGLDIIQFHKCCDVAGVGIWTVVTVNEGIFEGDDIIIEQYTGLKDKNGKEIYEGDILRTKGGSKSVVKFCEMKDSDCTYFYLGWASVYDGYGPMSLCEEAGFREVIGNIHENPELL